MEVTSLVVAWSLLAQLPSGPYGGPPAGGVPTPAPVPMGYPPSMPLEMAARDARTATGGTPAANRNVGAPQPAGVPASSLPPANLPAAPPPSSAPAPPNNGAGGAVAAAPPQATEDKSGAADLVRQALILPKSLVVEGRKLSLVEALGYYADRRARLESVRAYWRLSADVADFHYAWQQVQILKLLGEAVEAGEPQGPQRNLAAADVASRYAAAQARMREAQLQLNDSQVDAAQRAGLPTTRGLPLPHDLPHVGIYRTYFDKLYGAGGAPPRAVLLNKTLPLRHEVVTARAQTVWGAQDAYDAAFEAYRRRQLPAEEVLSAIADLDRRRTEFISAVRRYNEEIAEYAFMSAPEGTSTETLVGMLVKTPHTPSPSQTSAAAGFTDVETVTFVDEFGNAVGTASPIDAPEPTPIPTPDPVSYASSPTMPAAAPSGFSGPGYAVPPTSGAYGSPPAMPMNALPAVAAGGMSSGVVVPQSYAAPPTPPGLFVPEASAKPLGAGGPVSGGPPTSGFSSAGAAASSLQFAPPAAAPVAPAVQTQSSPGRPTPAPPQVPVNSLPAYRANRIPLTMGDPRATGGDGTAVDPSPAMRFDVDVQPASFAAQAGQSPARRTQELIESLHRATTPEADVQPTALEECLRSGSTTTRLATVAAYWNTAESAARGRARMQTAARLESLGQSALRAGNTPAGGAAMLRIQTAKLAAEADRRADAVALLAARWHLTYVLGRPLSGPWAAPATLPHAGGYRTKVETLSASSATNARWKRTAARIPVLHEGLQLRAESVLAGGAAADQAVAAFVEGRAAVGRTLEVVDRGDVETCELLRRTTQYNVEIAEYALNVLPGATPRDTLVSTLVVPRATVVRRP